MKIRENEWRQFVETALARNPGAFIGRVEMSARQAFAGINTVRVSVGESAALLKLRDQTAALAAWAMMAELRSLRASVERVYGEEDWAFLRPILGNLATDFLRETVG